VPKEVKKEKLLRTLLEKEMESENLIDFIFFVGDY